MAASAARQGGAAEGKSSCAGERRSLGPGGSAPPAAPLRPAGSAPPAAPLGRPPRSAGMSRIDPVASTSGSLAGLGWVGAERPAVALGVADGEVPGTVVGLVQVHQDLGPGLRGTGVQ